MSEIEPGDGWRLLGPDERVRALADERYGLTDGEWHPVSPMHYLWKASDFHAVRRRIPAKPEPLELKDSNGELDASAGPKDCSLMQDGRGELPEVIVLSGTQEIRQLADWLTRYAEWREAQGVEVSE
jgi:hypothetical protein